MFHLVGNESENRTSHDLSESTHAVNLKRRLLHFPNDPRRILEVNLQPLAEKEGEKEGRKEGSRTNEEGVTRTKPKITASSLTAFELESEGSIGGTARTTRSPSSSSSVSQSLSQ